MVATGDTWVARFPFFFVPDRTNRQQSVFVLHVNIRPRPEADKLWSAVIK